VAELNAVETTGHPAIARQIEQGLLASLAKINRQSSNLRRLSPSETAMSRSKR
jgi:hypothetical protein